MFELIENECKIAHLNIRDEKHGEEKVLAIDIKFQVDLPNKVLDQISEGLMASMYGADEAQDELFEGGHLPKLRHALLAPLKCDLGSKKVALTIHRVTHDVKLEGEIKKITLDCKAGGTVSVTFTVACKPEADVVGKLSGMLSSMQSVSMAEIVEKPAAELE